MSKVAIYIRWSTEDQGQGTTLEVQSEACRSYCDRQGWFVPDDRIFVDDGFSGGSLVRPAITRVRKLVETGEVDTIVVYRLDRLSRNLADATNLVDREFKNRAVVRSATEDVQPEADEGWLNYSFRAAFADYERRVIRQRTMAGRVRRHKEGRKAHGKIPYGWRQTNKKGFLEIHPEEAEVVREFFRRTAYENTGCPALARWANSMGFPAPEGDKWHQSVIRRLIQNPVYGGRIVFGRFKQLKQHKEDPGPWRTVKAPVVDVEADQACLPPIIDRELWETAQRALESRAIHTIRGRAVSNPHVLSGVLFCRCGSKMQPKKRGTDTTRNFGSFYYRCYREAEIERCPVQSGYLEGPMLEAQVEAELLRHLNSDDLREGLAERLQKRSREEAALIRSEFGRVTDELRKLEKELATVDKLLRREEITVAEARRLRAGVEAEAAELTARQEDLKARLEQTETSKQDHQILLAQLDLAANWDVLDVLEKKQVLASFIERIETYRPRTGGDAEVTIYWRFAEPTEAKMAQPTRRRKAAEA